MSDLTPPKYWKTQGQADHWLDRFIKEVEGPVGDAKFFRLSALVFDKVREGWETRIVLKPEFADDPDALAEFIRYDCMPDRAREMEEELRKDKARFREEMEASRREVEAWLREEEEEDWE